MVISIAVQATAWCDYVNAYNLAMKNHTITWFWIIRNLSVFLKKPSDFKNGPLSGTGEGEIPGTSFLNSITKSTERLAQASCFCWTDPFFGYLFFCFLVNQSLKLVESHKCAFKICSLRHGSSWCLVKLLLITGLSAVMIFSIYTF